MSVLKIHSILAELCPSPSTFLEINYIIVLITVVRGGSAQAVDLAGAGRLLQWGAGQSTDGGTAGAHGDVRWPFTDVWNLFHTRDPDIIE